MSRLRRHADHRSWHLGRLARGSLKELSDMTLEDTKRILVGEWVSVTPEVRPSATRNPDGTLKPFYLSREFKYLGDDRFELTVTNWADPYGKVAVARIDLRGHIEWVGEHPIASGAQKANFIADEAYEVTPMIAGFADLLKGKRILVTGGGTGLGREIAGEYAKLGAEVYVCGRRGAVVAETARELAETHNTRVTPIECDIRSRDAVENMMTRVFNEGPP